MLHCLNPSGNLGGSCSDMTVLERQRARMKWQQDHHHEHQQHQHQHQGYCSASGVFSSSLQVHDSGSSLADVVAHSIKPDPMPNGWPKLDKVVMGFGSSGLPPLPVPAPAASSGFDANSAISRTSSCPPVLAEEAKGKESFKKRKADKPPNTKVVAESDDKDKRIKVGAEDGESKITGQTSTKNNSATTNNKNNTDTTICADATPKENSKAPEVQKPDYIHVRARRGQATDSHSLAERVRRKKLARE